MKKEQTLEEAISLLEERKGKFIGVKFRGKTVDQVIDSVTIHPLGKFQLNLKSHGHMNKLLLHPDNVSLSKCRKNIRVRILFGNVYLKLDPGEAQFH